MTVQNYHRHTYGSNPIIGDSVVSNEDYCKRAVEVGASIISSCEHGTQGNYRECAELAEKYGLHWRYVTETYFVKDRFEKDGTNCHMILAAKTEKGIGDLNEALSEANLTGYHHRPRIDLEILSHLDPKDVFVTTACIAGVFKYGFEEAEKLICFLNEHFKNSFMLEVQYHNTSRQIEVNKFILKMYRKYGIPLIMGMDSHYIFPEQEELRTMYLEGRKIKYNDDERGWYMDYPDNDTAYQRFVDQGVLSAAQIHEAMENTNIFLSFEDVHLDKSKKLPTIYPNLTQEERNQLYLDLIHSKWDEYKKNVPVEKWPIYEKGIEYETNTIVSTNTSDYFLLDYNLVKRGKELGGMLTLTGRGSAPSFFTNTLLGFSSIDRFALPVTMYPDRFISQDRLKAGSLPDIDLNVGDQAPFEQAQAEIMGEWKSAPMVAFGTLKRASAWKLYCRANDVPFEIANSISTGLKQYDQDYRYADDDEKDDLDVLDYVPKEYHEYLKKSEAYFGVIDSISPHPCAYLLCQKDIRREIGLFRLNNKTGKNNGEPIYAAFIDGATAERYGYLKNDLLKVDVVKVNASAYQRAGIKQPTVSELLELTKNDSATWNMYAKGYTMGLNQAEKEKSTLKVMRYKPKNISEMSAFVAGIRPAFQSMLELLLTRQHFDYGIEALDKLLQTPEMPNSFILYQEQMMTVLQYAGFSAPESYSSIKAIAKKHPEKVLPLKERFLKGFSQRLIQDEGIAPSLAKETSDKVWVIISDACGYGFNSCLTGDTKILRNSCGNGFHPTIEEMYRIRNDKEYAYQTGHKNLRKKYLGCGYGKALSLCADGRIRENDILDIRDQGVRDVYRIRLESGRKIKCTENHKFPLGSYNHLVRADELKIGDNLFIIDKYQKSNCSHRYTNGDNSNLPKIGQRGFQKRPNGGSVLFNEFRESCVKNSLPCSSCGESFDEGKRFELHHIDGNSANNSSDNLEWLCASCHKKAHYRFLDRTKRYEKGIPSDMDKIVSIEHIGQDHVYDVEMADPYHNFVIDNGIVTGNSHSVSVAFDSLYGAYAKAHYPFEYYVTLLSNYSEKGNKEKISNTKAEMKKAFGIKIAPCRFGQDNRTYSIDKENRTVSDALTSVKFIGLKDAEALYDLKDNHYDSFVDLLVDMDQSPALNARVIGILIRLGYFEMFGTELKLLSLYYEFAKGKNRYSKNHTEKTKEKRLAALREMEDSIPNGDMDWRKKLAFEARHCCIPISEFPEHRGHFTVIDVDDKYSPKIHLYNVSSGTVGLMKVKKGLYKRIPLKTGDTIRLYGWDKKPCYKYSEGERILQKGVFELWINNYEKIADGENIA